MFVILQNKCKAISDKMVSSKPKPHQPNKQAIWNHLSESFKQQNTNMHLYLDRSYCSNGHNGHVFLFHLLNKISGIFYDSTKYTYLKCTNAITQFEHTHTHILLSHKLSVSFLVVDRLIFVPIQNQWNALSMLKLRNQFDSIFNDSYFIRFDWERICGRK